MLLAHVEKCVLLEFNIQIKKYCLFHWGRVDCGYTVGGSAPLTSSVEKFKKRIANPPVCCWEPQRRVLGRKQGKGLTRVVCVCVCVGLGAACACSHLHCARWVHSTPGFGSRTQLQNSTWDKEKATPAAGPHLSLQQLSSPSPPLHSLLSPDRILPSPPPAA